MLQSHHDHRKMKLESLFMENALDDQTILASEENFGNVTVCPGGVVHINLAHLTVKFLPSDFVRFSDLISKARLKFDPPRPGKGKPKLHVVSDALPCDVGNHDKD
jgi:hypothetical protein